MLFGFANALWQKWQKLKKEKQKEKQMEELQCPKCSGINNHINAVNLHNVDDDYKEIQNMEVTIQDSTLHTKQIKPSATKFPYRLRSEIGVNILLKCEHCRIVWRFKLFHHKGTVYAEIEIPVEENKNWEENEEGYGDCALTF